MTPVELTSVLCSSLVGALFLLTGGIKALAPAWTYRYFIKIGAHHRVMLPAFIWFAAFAECMLGIALVLRVAPQWLLLGTIALLAVFAVFTHLTASKVGDDCGCYGRLMSMSPARNMMINGGFGVLALLAWQLPVPAFVSASAQLALMAAAGILLAAVITYTHRHYRKTGQDWLDLSPARAGRPWRPEWLEGYAKTAAGGRQLVVLMAPTCELCKLWVRPLNKIAQRADMPQVIGAAVAEPEALQEMVAQRGIAFPVLRAEQTVMDRLVAGFPTVVVIDNGVIVSKTEGKLPEDLLQRLKHARQAPAEPGHEESRRQGMVSLGAV